MTFFQRIKTPFTDTQAEEQARLQPRMRLIGELLCERREDLGLDLDEIGAMLRIRPAYLAALEQGRSDDLPGPTYAIGFVRAYADFLGLDSEQVLSRFKAETSGVTARPDLALPVPLGERSLPGGALVLVALIVALCGYGIWYYLSTEQRNRPERVAEVPAPLRELTGPVLVQPPSRQSADAAPNADARPPNTPAPSLYGAATSAPQTAPVPANVAPPSAPAASPPAASAPAASPPAASPPAANAAPGTLVGGLSRGGATTSSPQTAAVAPSPAPSAPVSAAPPPAPASSPSLPNPAPGTPVGGPSRGTPASSAPQTVAAAAPPASSASAAAIAPSAPASVTASTPGPAAATNGRVAIKALTDCWIQVRAPDQSIVFSRVLKSGEVYNVPARSGLFLRTGNAGALEISVDGKTAPSIGSIGTLRRDVALDPSELAAGTAVHG